MLTTAPPTRTGSSSMAASARQTSAPSSARVVRGPIVLPRVAVISEPLAARAWAAARRVALALALGVQLERATQHRLELAREREARVEAVEPGAPALDAHEHAAVGEPLELVLHARQRHIEAIGQLLRVALAVGGDEGQHLGRGGVAEEAVEHHDGASVSPKSSV